ncbi:MAG: hypothetical protein E6J03_11880 [Chloroflexi bacterium]|nr:MAG: hypothetical protein E6J03_11880 [Chloroflexota bacterium]
MTGPELDHELETLGRRLSPRVGGAHDAVVTRATLGASGRRPRTAPPRPNSGPAVALTTGAPGSPGGAPATQDATLRPLPASAAPRVVVPPPPVATGAPPAPVGGPVAPPARTAPPPAPTVTTTAPPSNGPEPSWTATPTEDPGPQPSPAPPPSSRWTSGHGPMRIVLTQQDNGRTITVHRGDIVEVDLSAPQNAMRWTEPQSTDETVARRSSGAARSDGSAYAVFGAAQDGNAGILASRMPACYFSTPRCLPPQRIDFQVTIVVTG